MLERKRRVVKSCSGSSNQLDASDRQSSWLFMQGRRGDFGRVSSRALSPGPSRPRLFTRARVYGDGNAHIPIQSAQSYSYARPLELHSFIKVASRAAPCLAPGRPFTSGARTLPLTRRCIYKEHTHAVVSLHGGKKLCANGRDRYQRS